MAIVTTDSKYYTDIANAINDKLGTSTPMYPREMAGKIASITGASALSFDTVITIKSTGGGVPVYYITISTKENLSFKNKNTTYKYTDIIGGLSIGYGITLNHVNNTYFQVTLESGTCYLATNDIFSTYTKQVGPKMIIDELDSTEGKWYMQF